MTVYRYVLIPKQFSDIMWKIGEWYAKTYPLQVVPEYAIAAFAKLGGLPPFLRFTTTKYDQYIPEAVFYYPYAWVMLQVVLANQVIYLSILRSDIPSETYADGVGMIHRHPLPGMCSPEDCAFQGNDQTAVIANVVWSDAYHFNDNFVCACTPNSGERETKIITYDVDELECTHPSCENGKVPSIWYEQALSPLQLSKIMVFPDLSEEYVLKKLLGLNIV